MEESLGKTSSVTSDDDVAPSAGSHTSSVTSCPFTLGSTVGQSSKIEFRNKMGSVVVTNNTRDKVVQIADIADACNVSWGSCGNFAGTVNALAGIGNTSCISTDGKCNDGTKGTKIFELNKIQRKFLAGWLCNVDSDAAGKQRPPGECVQTKNEAVKKVRDYFLSEKQAGNLTSDWPDGIADKLRPGDRITVYNGNKDLMGSHAAIFVGWAGNGQMQVIQGGAGGKGDENGRARKGTICVKTSCGESMIPLIGAWSAGQ